MEELRIVKYKKNLYMDIIINGYMISSIAGVEFIQLKGNMLTYTTRKYGNLNFIHHVKEIKENINTDEYINYHIILDTDKLRD